MQNLLGQKILSAIAVALLAACAGGGNGGVPNAASSLSTAQSPLGQEAGSVAVLSGEYDGKFRKTGNRGAFKALLVLSQTQKSVFGGALISREGSQGLAAAIAWTASGHTISGTAVSPQGSGVYCTFSMSAKYKYRRISGSYSALYGCSGQTGTFNLWHKCYFQGTGSDAIRPEGGVKPC